jgi:hypothetical protein
MALALDHHPAHRPAARSARHLRLVEPLDPTPVGLPRATYLRRRVMVVVVTLLVVAGAVFASRAQADDVRAASVPQYVIAQEGDTLWRIAERIAPNAPVSDVVDALVQLNGTSLRVGQVVLVP